MSERLESDVVVVGAGLAGSGRGARARGAGCARRRARSPRPRRRPGAQPRPRQRRRRRARRRVDRARAAPHQQAGRRARPRDVPHLLTRARTSSTSTARSSATRARSRRCPKAALVDLGQSQFRFDRLAKRVPLEAPWAADRAERWDEETFATWVRRNTRTASARFFWEVFAEAVFAAEPQDFSLLYALAYTHSGGGVNSLIGVRNAAQQDRIVGGTQLHRAAPGRAARRRRAPRRAGAAHRAARRRRDRRGRRRSRCSARRVIVSIPPVLAGRIAYEPPLPARRDQLTQKMPAGSVIKINVVYDEPFWRAEGLERAGRRRPVADQVHLRQLAAVGNARACSCASSKARRRGCSAGSTPPSAGARCSRRSSGYFGRARRQAGRRTSSRTGRRRSGPAAATARTCRPAC